MTYTPGQQVPPPSVAITFASPESVFPIARMAGSQPASATWVAANRSIYVPIRLLRTATAYRMFCQNGATVGTDTITVALYNSDTDLLPSSRIVTASATSAGTANQCQFFDITDTTLIAGRLYFMGIAMSGTTATIFRSAPGVGLLADFGVWQDASVCPDPAVPAICASAYIPVFGVSLRTTP